jgi:hypothetical protein
MRTLDNQAAEMIANGAVIYVRRWRHYARALKKIG